MLRGFSPPDCQDKPKVDNDGKPDVSGTPRHGSCNFSRFESLREQEAPGRRHGSAVAGTRPGCRTSESAPVTTARPWTVTGRTSRKTGKTPDADWGKHETTGVDGKTGNLWRKVKSWFGYGLRADTKYEIPVAFSVTRASRAETKELNGDKL